jgi:diacylglycerol kinase (ATP)
MFSTVGTILRFALDYQEDTMRVTLIHNPDAGDHEEPSGEKLIRLIRSKRHEVIYQSSAAGNWKDALKAPGDIVAAAGGDGLVGKVAKHLIGKAVPLAVLPMGTANNLAKSLGLADRPLEELIAGWPRARRVKFDIGVASGPWGSKHFIEGLGIGLFTQTMYRLDARGNANLAHAYDTAKKLTSVLELLRERLASCPLKTLKLVLDGHDLSGDYFLVEVMNIKCIGPNLNLAPKADPSDGILDIVLLSKGEEEKLNEYLSAGIENKPCSPNLNVRRGRRLQLDWEGSVIHIDDEVWPEDGSAVPAPPAVIDVTVAAESVRFLMPK